MQSPFFLRKCCCPALATLFVTRGMILGVIAAVICGAPVVAPAETAAGRVLFSFGDAGAQRDTEVVTLEKGDEIFAGDKLVTAEGRLQIKFTDGGTISLGAFSTFRIDEYRYGPGSGNGRGFFSLLKGGVRAITGAIGKRRPERYQVQAVVATIGIRGTAFKSELCNNDCVNSDGSDREDGLYHTTSLGTTILINNAGSLTVAAGQSAYVKDIDTMPVLKSKATDAEPLAIPQAGEVGLGKQIDAVTEPGPTEHHHEP